MSGTLDHYIRSLEDLELRAPVFALFDLDRTLIAGYSLIALAARRIAIGGVGLAGYARIARTFLDYYRGATDYEGMLKGTLSTVVGMRHDYLVQQAQIVFSERTSRWIYREGARLIQAHRALGHEVAILTSATVYQAEPIARALGVDRVFATDVELQDGVVTGRVEACYGESKRARADAFAASRDGSLESAFFYSDSAEDLPLLEAVARPVVVNGKRGLSAEALARGWPRLTFRARGLG